MDVTFVSGWPFRPPKVRVEGMRGEHVSPRGTLCLWADDADDGAWDTLAGLLERVAGWAAAAASGFSAEDAALDAHLYFRADAGAQGRIALATIDLAAFDFGQRARGGKVVAAWQVEDRVLKIEPAPGSGIQGDWFEFDAPAAPPSSLDDLVALADKRQAKTLGRRLASSRPGAFPRVLVATWARREGRQVLVLLVTRDDAGAMKARALEVAPVDEASLRLRAGSDADVLATRTVCLFGAGAIGSHVALMLAECGLGSITLVDSDRLRPSNIVRHVCGHEAVGYPKVEGVGMVIGRHAPWTNVAPRDEAPWSPADLADCIGSADVAIDCTGHTSFTRALSYVAARRGVPLLSAALYRGGAVARVRRFLLSDVSLDERHLRYPRIPKGDDGPPTLEVGCSSPVNNASPIAVATAAALLAESAVDVLSGRYLLAEERVTVLRPLDVPPFDVVGPVGL